jgi:hypothetical protein
MSLLRENSIRCSLRAFPAPFHSTSPAALSCLLQLVCVVSPASGAVEIGSTATSARPRSHFYASLAATRLKGAAGIAGELPSFSSRVASALLHLRPFHLRPASWQAVAEVAPTPDVGCRMHPAVCESSLHLPLAHLQQQGGRAALRVAAKMEVVRAPMHACQRGAWAASLAEQRGSLTHQWLLDSSGTAVGGMGYVETRRLATERPPTTTPK